MQWQWFEICSSACGILNLQEQGLSKYTITHPSRRSIWFIKLIWKFARIMAMILPCFIQNLKTIWHINYQFCVKEFSRDLSLRCISYGYPYIATSPRSPTYMWNPNSVTMHADFLVPHDTWPSISTMVISLVWWRHVFIKRRAAPPEIGFYMLQY